LSADWAESARLAGVQFGMKYRLATLLAVVTVLCVVLALNTYNFATRMAIGVPLGLLVWELVQFGRELARPV
jgi:hypothetical protein